MSAAETGPVACGRPPRLRTVFDRPVPANRGPLLAPAGDGRPRAAGAVEA